MFQVDYELSTHVSCWLWVERWVGSGRFTLKCVSDIYRQYVLYDCVLYVSNRDRVSDLACAYFIGKNKILMLLLNHPLYLSFYTHMLRSKWLVEKSHNPKVMHWSRRCFLVKLKLAMFGCLEVMELRNKIINNFQKLKNWKYSTFYISSVCQLFFRGGKYEREIKYLFLRKK